MRIEEHRIQRQIVEYLLFNRVEVFAIPNGGHRDVATAMVLKREGVRRGIADLVILGKNKTYFIEVKTAKGKQSIYQTNFEEIIHKTNLCKYMIWLSIDDYEEFLAKHKADLLL